MEILKYFFCVKDEETPTNNYQLNLGKQDENGEYQLEFVRTGWEDFDLEQFLFAKIEDLKITEINKFLNYHFELCSNKNDFLIYTKNIIELGLISNDKERTSNFEDLGSAPFKVIIIDKFKAEGCLKWIEKKLELIENNITSSNQDKEKQKKKISSQIINTEQQDFFDFDEDKKKANEIENLLERKLFMLQRKNGFFKAMIENRDDCLADLNQGNFYQPEIDYIDGLIKLQEQKNLPLPKNTEPIKWNNDAKQLAYLFWKLKKENIIENKNLGLTLSKIFIDKNFKETKNTIFNKHFSDFDNNSNFPTKTIEIDNFIKSIKEFIKK